MANTDTAKAILNEVGGAENIELLTNCATRLRFTLYDATKVSKEKVEAIPGVLAAIPQGDKAFQVVIGPAVENMRKEIEKLLDSSPKAEATNSSSQDKRSIEDIKAEHRSKVRGKKSVDAFFEYLNDSFRPIIGILLAASLVIAAINVLIALGVISSDTENSTVLFFKAIAQSVFYFIGVFVAYNACKKLKCDPWIGVMVMMVMLTPQFLALANPEMYASVFGAPEEVDSVINAQGMKGLDALSGLGISNVTNVMGLPMLQANYNGNVFVPLLMAPVLAFLYKFLKKVLPDSMHLIFVPVICVVVMSIVVAFIIGPISIIAGTALGQGLTWLNTKMPLLLIFVIPLLYPFLVPLGLHWPLNALMIANISTLGYDFIQGPMGIYDFACYGASFGVLLIAIREKDKNMKSVAAGAVAAGLLGGISEPSLYGIHLRYKKAYPIMIIGCVAGAISIGGLGMLFPSEVAGTTVAGVTTKAFAFTSLLTIPVFDKMWVYAASIGVAFVVPAIIVFVFDYRTQEQKIQMRAVQAAEQTGMVGTLDYIAMPAEQAKQIGSAQQSKTLDTVGEIKMLAAPIKGKTIKMSKVKDPAFKNKVFGEGLAFMPSKTDGPTNIISPVSGVVKNVARDKQTFTIMSDEGIGVLVHIGINSAKLGGQGLELIVKDNAKVNKGDALVTVDFAKFEEAKVDKTVIMSVVNTRFMKLVEPVVAEGKEISAGDDVVKVQLKK